ncbi:hypothetical protein [Staphylococcus epidermidis]|uniref:hypothetical protein n=1 Tax=Staphylococcus epidermidis TaxID=1282 RepID=UPI001643263C|nr:hypothetical protein [Staphylococcus epidermidis]
MGVGVVISSVIGVGVFIDWIWGELGIGGGLGIGGMVCGREGVGVEGMRNGKVLGKG